ncbi:MAG: aromatic amino acid lyase, partial [Anaerolineales bacterium]|nr:aromatic amino acid lyase [Anaerolineales bacterium]
MITINGNDLTIEEVIAVARHGEQVELAAEAYQAIERSHGWVEEILAANKP